MSRSGNLFKREATTASVFSPTLPLTRMSGGSQLVCLTSECNTPHAVWSAAATRSLVSILSSSILVYLALRGSFRVSVVGYSHEDTCCHFVSPTESASYNDSVTLRHVTLPCLLYCWNRISAHRTTFSEEPEISELLPGLHLKTK